MSRTETAQVPQKTPKHTNAAATGRRDVPRRTPASLSVAFGHDDLQWHVEICSTSFVAGFDRTWGRAGWLRVDRRGPCRAPRANAYAERFVGTVRRECLEWILIVGRRHLERVLHLYIDHYNTHRPHRGFDLSPPQPSSHARPHEASLSQRRLRRRDRLGGLIHEYTLAA